MKRCFISIELPENVKKEIKKIQDSLPEFIGKKTEIQNLHLTLKFLGEIDNNKIEIVKKKLFDIKFDRLNCNINSIGVFSEDFIKIVWVYLDGCSEIQKKVDSALKNLFKKEERFMSHITIARIKSVKKQKNIFRRIKKNKI